MSHYLVLLKKTQIPEKKKIEQLHILIVLLMALKILQREDNYTFMVTCYF